MFKHVKSTTGQLVHIELVCREVPITDGFLHKFGALLGNRLIRAMARLRWLLEREDTIHKILRHLRANEPRRWSSPLSDVTNEASEIVVTNWAVQSVGSASSKVFGRCSRIQRLTRSR